MRHLESYDIFENDNPEPNVIDSFDSLFTSPEWKRRLKNLGLEDPREMKYKEDHDLGIYFGKDLKDKSPMGILKNVLFKDIPIQKWPRIPSLHVIRSNVPEFKSKIAPNSTRDDPGWVRIKIGGTSVEEIERKIIDKYIKIIKGVKYPGYERGEHPILKLATSILSGEDVGQGSEYFDLICKHLAQEMDKNPLFINQVEEPYLSGASKIAGYSKEDVDAIRTARDYGII
jgi:hypothetical protein